MEIREFWPYYRQYGSFVEPGRKFRIAETSRQNGLGAYNRQNLDWCSFGFAAAISMF
jgi:hypothetical protein